MATCTDTLQKKPSCLLFALPLELREQIFFYTLVAPNDYISITFTGKVYLGGPLLRCSRQHLAILRTCRALHHEAYPILLSHNVFITESFTDGYHPQKDRNGFFMLGFCRQPIHNSLLRHIRHLCVPLILDRQVHWHPETDIISTYLRLGLFLEWLAQYKAELRTIFILSTYHDEEEHKPSCIKCPKALLPSMKHLLTGSRPPTTYFANYHRKWIGVEPTSLVTASIRYCLLQEQLSNTDKGLLGVQRTGLFFSEIYPFENCMLNEDNTELRFYIPEKLEMDIYGEVSLSSPHTKVPWQDFHPQFFSHKTHISRKSKPEKGIIDNEELLGFNIKHQERSNRNEEYRLLDEILNLWNVDDQDRLIHSRKIQFDNMPILWEIGREEYNSIRLALIRWALYDVACSSRQPGITDYFLAKQ